MALGKKLGNILESYFGEESLQSLSNNYEPISNLPIKETKPKAKINITPYPTLIGNLANDKSDTSNPKTLATDPVQSVASSDNDYLDQVPINRIEVSNPFQTREYFDVEALNNLAEDIGRNGLIQPVILIKSPTPAEDRGFRYILVAGERRLRAFKQLARDTIPAIVKSHTSLNNKQQSIITVMENLQREDLSALEMAKTIQMLMRTHNSTEAEVAGILCKSLQYVKNFLRLLTLSPYIQDLLSTKQLTESQARYLVNLDESTQVIVAHKIISEELTVKEIVQLVKSINSKSHPVQKSYSPRLQHNLPHEFVKRAIKFSDDIPNANLKCFGDDLRGRIVISWGV